MAINKNAIARYMALDQCLSSTTSKYYIEDLVEACQKRLEKVNGDSGAKGAEGVQKRQVYDDINDMEMLYGVTIDRIKEGRRRYFRYAPYSKTLQDAAPSQEEMDAVNRAIDILSRFDGLQDVKIFSDDIQKKIYSVSQAGAHAQKIISFQSNPYLKGMDTFFKPIFDAIVAKKVITIEYEPFGREKQTYTVSPYHLKQYNNRWFLIAKRGDFAGLSNYAIDRISSVEVTGKKYEALPEDFSFGEHFEDVVGVSVPTHAEISHVVLHVTKNAWNYISTKPIHESQRANGGLKEDGKYEITLDVIINYELKAQLRSFGTDVEVIAPVKLREDMLNEAKATIEMYSK